ncbi:MAG TPA: hypothetical protein VFQ44_04815 [Streptosporangiaceae bacterium]|nr:hypothetical protein [Streptosporangiaceae bacterium]
MAAALPAAAFLAPAASAQVPALALGPAAHLYPDTSHVLMINGDRLTVRHMPTGEVSSMIPAPDGGATLTLRIAGTTYDVPVDALPYLGRGLDPSLFNRALLERLETGGKLEVKISFNGQRPSLPGVRVKRWGGTTATGFVTASSAKVFGAALFRQFVSQHATGNYRAGGMFAGGVSVALAGAPASVPVRPQFAMHTLTVAGKTLGGKADNGDVVLVFNADNALKFGDPFEAENDFFHGTSNFSVPSGHYWAITDFVTPLKHNIAQRLVVAPQFMVTGNTRLRLSASSASSEITFETPRPAVSSFDTFTVARTDGHHQLLSINALAFGAPMWVSPTRTKPTVGTIQSFTFAQLVSPKKVKGTPYVFSLDFAGPAGVIPKQHFTASPASLATVHERYFLNARSQSAWSTDGGFAQQLEGFVIFGFNPITMPGLQTQYLTGGPDIMWTSSTFSFNGQGQDDVLHTVPAGKQLTDNWNEYPLHPQPDVQLLTGRNARIFSALPSAWRSGDELFLLVNPFSDNELGHLGDADFGASSSLTENGKKVRMFGFPGFQDAKLNPAPGTVVYSITTTHADPLDTLSARTTTAWTFPSARNASAKIPRNWICANARFFLTQKCSIPSMLSLNYTVAKGLALNGVAAAGPQTLDLTVGHFQPSATQAAISKLTAQVSYDGGQFWQAVKVQRTGAGHYQVSFTPPAGVDVSLRITTADASGAAMAETIVNAYSVGQHG